LLSAGRLVWESQRLQTLFDWLPGLLPKHFSSFVLHLKEDLQHQLEQALVSRPWVFGFADVCFHVGCLIDIYNMDRCTLQEAWLLPR